MGRTYNTHLRNYKWIRILSRKIWRGDTTWEN